MEKLDAGEIFSTRQTLIEINGKFVKARQKGGGGSIMIDMCTLYIFIFLTRNIYLLLGSVSTLLLKKRCILFLYLL